MLTEAEYEGLCDMLLSTINTLETGLVLCGHGGFSASELKEIEGELEEQTGLAQCVRCGGWGYDFDPDGHCEECA